MAAESILKNKPDWEEAKARFNAWWQRSSIDRPAIHIMGILDEPLEPLEEVPEPADDRDRFLDVERQMKIARNSVREYSILAESYPQVNLNIGPGSLAIYLGSEPIFHPTTVWFKDVVEDWREFGALKYDPDNYWLKTHLGMIEQAVELANGEFLVTIPDLIENIDILAALRDPNALCYDLIDEPELMHEYLDQLDDLYFPFFDDFYNLVKADDGSSCFTCFNVWGPGRTIKTQCDFSALMSPNQFREFVTPSMAKQCAHADSSLYHLDGPDAIKHLDALMEVEELDALQWTPGAGNPGAAEECWDEIHDKVKDAGKCLWVNVGFESFDEAVAKGKRLTKRYGRDGLYLLFGLMPDSEARELIKQAETW